MPVEEPLTEEAWCAARGVDVALHMQRLELEIGRIGEWPAWHVMPYASIWAVESLHRPEFVGWWVICGDLPTDSIAAQDLPAPRDALRAFGKRWVQQAESLDRGEVAPQWAHLPDEVLPKLTAQLRSRGTALQVWADNESSWPPLSAN
jgi:hypothetical protein